MDATGKRPNGEKSQVGLWNAVREGDAWPTPMAGGGTGYLSGSNRDVWRPTLEGAVQGREPTPVEQHVEPAPGPMEQTPPMLHSGLSAAARGLASSIARPRAKLPLVREVPAVERDEPWGTPTARDEKGPTLARDPSHGQSLPNQLGLTSRGALNPDWVETLMGLPVGWTVVERVGK
jgi:hypothetical protein